MQYICDFGHRLFAPIVFDISKFRILCRPNVNFLSPQWLVHQVHQYVGSCNTTASFGLWNINISQLVIIFRFPRQVVARHHGLDGAICMRINGVCNRDDF